jgi:hypothetical protein
MRISMRADGEGSSDAGAAGPAESAAAVNTRGSPTNANRNDGDEIIPGHTLLHGDAYKKKRPGHGPGLSSIRFSTAVSGRPAAISADRSAGRFGEPQFFGRKATESEPPPESLKLYVSVGWQVLVTGVPFKADGVYLIPTMTSVPAAAPVTVVVICPVVEL